MSPQLERRALLDELVSKGIRVTAQRRALIEVIQEAREHLDAGALLELARKREPNINRATVYRTIEILKKLRQNLSTKAIPVLLLTARNQESDIARGFECGADDYVVKPFHPWDLAKRLDKIISAPARHSVFA